MKKSILTLLAIVTVISFGLMNCSKDDTKLVKVTGTITYGDQLKAAGAIVTISSEPNAAKVLTRVVADSVGVYSIPGLSDGTYYISAKYNTANSNLKSAEEIVFTTATDVTVSVSGSDVTSDIALVANTASGTDVIDIADWTFDQTHSHIAFTFDYDSANAIFGGQFASFSLNNFKFDQANPANTVIDAVVDITSTETGSPTLIDPVTGVAGRGRDGINGCISKTFGVTFKAEGDLTSEDTVITKFYTASAIIAPTGVATFKSTSVSAYGDGYVAKGNLTFKGLTKEVSLYFHYIKGFSATNKNNELIQYSSFQGFFDIKPLIDFNIVSGHVKSRPVHVVTNLQFNKKI